MGFLETAGEAAVGFGVEKMLEYALSQIANRFGNPKPEKKTNPQLYYEEIVEKFCRKEASDIVSRESLAQDSVYIDAYSAEHPGKKILDEIAEWCNQGESGVMLIHGEPGHGKTTLCRKAVYEYSMGNLYQDMSNVFWFRLNPAYSDIITNEELVLDKAFCWGEIKSKRNPISIDDCTESLLFLDGYDELKMQAQELSLTFVDFVDEVKRYAEEYQMHIVITTRTRSLEGETWSGVDEVRQFAPMTPEQQDNWIHARVELHDYEKDFERIRKFPEMKNLLGIPVLFRMVVAAQLKDTVTGVVDLYDKLFDATMKRRRIRDLEIENWRQKFEKLAYEIYRNDETFAEITVEQSEEEFLYLFYLKGGEKQHAEFIHRSFYQYFLARFLYRKLTEVRDENSAEAFLCCLAERKIDNDILHYIRQVQELEQNSGIQAACERVLDTIERTDGILEDAWKTIPKGDGSTKRLRICNNIFVNVLSICHLVGWGHFEISLIGRTQIRSLLKQHQCVGIYLPDVKLGWADLRGAVLCEAYLRIADLGQADLRGADFRKTDLNQAGLSGAHLSGADLRGADLSGTDLRGADLRGADLRLARNLDQCIVDSTTIWTGCKIMLRDRDKLALDHPDVHGIIWYDNDGRSYVY